MCKADETATEFYASPKASYCRSCRRKYNLQRLAEKRTYLDAVKMTSGCVDCGYRSHAEALEFDHLPGHVKLLQISDVTKHSLDAIKAEITKCEVVCANCHRVRTARRRQPCA